VRLAPKQYTLRYYSAGKSQPELGASAVRPLTPRAPPHARGAAPALRPRVRHSRGRQAAACAVAGAELSNASLATLREAFSQAFGHGTPRTKNRQWLVQRLQAQGQAQGLPPLAASGARACPLPPQPLPPRQHKLPSRLRDEPAAPGAAQAPPGKRAKAASKDAVAAAPPPQPQRRLSTLHPAQRGSLAPLARMALPCGTSLSPGDDVFLLTPKGLKALHSCAACAVEQPGATAQLLECERCLRGFHLACVQLPRVPAGAWICPDCAAMPGRAACVSDMQRFDQGLLFLAQVVSLWWDPSKQAVFFRARWYHAPPEKTTRWWLPGLPEPLREVALGPADDADVAGLGAVLRRALVVRPERAKAAAAAAQLAGDPMPLVCHRGFNPRKGTFMPLNAKRDKRR